jgi:hypothetical protein
MAYGLMTQMAEALAANNVTLYAVVVLGEDGTIERVEAPYFTFVEAEAAATLDEKIAYWRVKPFAFTRTGPRELPYRGGPP